MPDENIYGWTYAVFHASLGWDKGTQLVYESWENFWSRKIDAYIFYDSGETPRLTDANEVLDVGDIVNKMMTLMNLFLKGETVDNPLGMGMLEPSKFPRFEGNPYGIGTEDYKLLNFGIFYNPMF
ncbi:hypothetical protein LCGC14_2255540 [marine sediment metagenome]|uniref:Uncharacterized protein n=1 Tax=marine sediment metagenome TaxID=412755 RepID=A0A0F9D135_9ZZZZ